MLFNTKNPVRAGLHETGPCLSSNRGICTFGIPYLIATRFHPAGVNPFTVMAGLLTRPSRRAFPVLHQWQVAAALWGLTAAGTVPDSHRVPFSSGAANRPEPFPTAKLQYFSDNKQLCPSKSSSINLNFGWAEHLSRPSSDNVRQSSHSILSVVSFPTMTGKDRKKRGCARLMKTDTAS